jgi:ribonuclease E
LHAEDGEGEVSAGDDQGEGENDQAEGVDARQAQERANGSRFGETLSPDNVASAIEQPEIKVPRQRIWDVPSGAPNANDAVMLEGTASEVAAPEPTQAVDVSAPSIVEESAPAPAPATLRRRHEVGSSEPRIERVVVRPGEEAAELAAEAAPQRKGWWQRKFGGS